MLFPSAPAPQIAQLRALLAAPKRITIVTHYNPDGDAIGSSLGMAHVLRAAGHTVQVVLPNTPPGFLGWLPGFSTCIAWDKQPAPAVEAIRTGEMLFCLDFNRTDRAGGLEEAVKAAPVKVLIDHHQEPDGFAQILFTDTRSGSTCQMVFDVLGALGHGDLIDKDAATCLYTGLVTDSGSFRFSSTTPYTMRVAADLMERGVVIEDVHSAIMDDNSVERLKLLGFTLSERMTVLSEQRTVVLGLSLADLKRFDFKPGDTEGFVNYGLSIRGTRLAAFFMERPDMVKVSLRSKGTLPVDRFLKEHFNGGGHRNAAGGHTTGTVQSAIDRFLQHLPRFLAEHPA
jgi:phosphoesterase RecJ-like protein